MDGGNDFMANSSIRKPLQNPNFGIQLTLNLSIWSISKEATVWGVDWFRARG
jgi:hypothetical protein